MTLLRRRLNTLALATLALLLLGGASARAYVNSANWSGYAAHRSGTRFAQVSATWTEPSAACIPGRTTFGTFWIGIGGYGSGVHALEQVGTELDCTGAGTPRQEAWYEMVPSPSRRVVLPVHAGDSIAAAITVSGHAVTVVLADATAGHSFRKTLHVARTDISSAEWIVEAPSGCAGTGYCRLTNFGSMTFMHAAARSTSGRTGPISDPSWFASRLSLHPHNGQFPHAHQKFIRVGAATASRLYSGGSAFRVSFSRVVVRAARVIAREL